jgi:hypothetical protein
LPTIGQSCAWILKLDTTCVVGALAGVTVVELVLDVEVEIEPLTSTR